MRLAFVLLAMSLLPASASMLSASKLPPCSTFSCYSCFTQTACTSVGCEWTTSNTCIAPAS